MIAGRNVADAASRLDFEPRYLVGNHGVEWFDGRSDAAAAALQACRADLDGHRQELQQLRVVVEVKRLSVALHYRLARNPRIGAMLSALVASFPSLVRNMNARHGVE